MVPQAYCAKDFILTCSGQAVLLIPGTELYDEQAPDLPSAAMFGWYNSLVSTP